MDGFQDHFSGHSGAYARARPGYPPELFAFVASLPAERRVAWDCGTGSGQAARPLSDWFSAVFASDASAAQAAKAKRAPKVHYAVAAAERPPLRERSVDLVTVAQALHWFDFAAFFPAVWRVARPGAAFAAWCYGNCQVTPEVDAVYARLYGDIVGPYWPRERVHVEQGYRSIPMPFPPLAAPAFAMEARWNLAGYLAYLDTWSATQAYLRATGRHPFDLVRADFERAWGDPATVKKISFPLSLLAGRIRP